MRRTIGLSSAISLNVMNMIGVGPFITLPLVVAAMGGPQAILGWVLGAAIALCDGLVWAELGASIPHAGGSYVFLREIYSRASPAAMVHPDQAEGSLSQQPMGRFHPAPAVGPRAEPATRLASDPEARSAPHPVGNPATARPIDPGRYLAFLYIWQLSFTAPLSIASGCIGLAQYAAYLWPALHGRVFAHALPLRWTSLLAAFVCALVVLLLYRGVSAVTRIAGVLTVGVLLTVGAVIVTGFMHLQPALLRMPPHAFAPTHAFFEGLGTATLIATYDYWGYYTVCLLGGEIRRPGRTIPRAVLLSIALVTTLYLAMHIAVLGAVPWQQMVGGSSTHAAAAMLMEQTWGHFAAVVISLLIMWTAFASVAALLLGYSRAPYAAALDGNYFSSFARLHPRYGFPYVSLLALGGMAMLFCFFDLAQVIAALVAVRVVLQYVLQQIGVMVLRWRQPDRIRPFRMWLYPVPPILALAGFLFLLLSRKGAERELLFAAVVATTGTAIFLLRERHAGRVAGAFSPRA